MVLASFKNKKGQEEGFEYFVIIPLIAILFGFFSYFSAIEGIFIQDREIILNKIELHNDNILLLNYLRSDISYGNKSIQMFQLLNTRDEIEIEKNTKRIMAVYCQENPLAFKKSQCFWDLFVRYKEKELHYSGGSYPGVIEIYTKPFESSIRIKDQNNEDITIEIKRYAIKN